MNYEIAKQLKDNGFPQREAIIHQVVRSKEERAAAVYMPTFEELIAATPSLDSLAYLKNGIQGGNWVATVHYEDTSYTEKYGSTPSEAVANLWLALNAKEGDNSLT